MPYREIKGMVETALDMLHGLADFPESEPPLVRKVKPGEVSAKEFYTPTALESLYLSSDVGMAGMQTLSGPAKVSFFCKYESAHKSLSRDMGEHVATSPR